MYRTHMLPTSKGVFSRFTNALSTTAPAPGAMASAGVYLEAPGVGVGVGRLSTHCKGL